ncbi:MAG: histidine ammonia-lyase [Thermoplasmata archaeon]
MVKIDGNNLTTKDVLNVSRYFERVEIDEQSLMRVIENRKNLENLIAKGDKIYGVNTGFGDLININIGIEKARELQNNLVRSHSSGVMDYFQDEIVRGAMLIRANTLLKGFSGVRPEVIKLLVSMINLNILPLVPSRGSVGASGDLAPLAHVALAMIGEWKVKYKGEIKESKTVFNELNIPPLSLMEKEGVAIINGTSFMASISSLAVEDSLNILENSIISSSMSIEALSGTDDAFRNELLSLRPHEGQIKVGKGLMQLLNGSEIIKESKKNKIQDAYSIRCIPQVLGPVYETIKFVKGIVEREINSVTDNPVVLDRAYSGGNFHGEYIAMSMDFLGIAISEIANIAERRIARMVDSKLSGLPPFLTMSPGISSGMMIPQYTAASLVSENKVLSHPASVDSIPTSANQEDHVSMGMISSIKARQIIENTTYVVAIEFLVASQALEFKKYSMGKGTEIAYKKIREHIAPLKEDRPLNPDIENLVTLIKNHEIVNAVKEKLNFDL